MCDKLGGEVGQEYGGRYNYFSAHNFAKQRLKNFGIDVGKNSQVGQVWAGQFETNIHSLCYVLEMFGKISGKCETLQHLDQSKQFDRVKHQNPALVFVGARLRSNFCIWITALYSDIVSNVRENGVFSKQIKIESSLHQICPL